MLDGYAGALGDLREGLEICLAGDLEVTWYSHLFSWALLDRPNSAR